uniref:uncharacterized protein LOC122610166 n=1 Tax=Erigeron canadensis TaxID=72917 RepID=UPI001CB8CAA5|nr:uncharacterized protein LOC122610166 [Erigeron canadensis]
MATLQKIRLLATQCAVAPPTRSPSPSTSPVIHLRRRKTLRMLLGRRRMPEFTDRSDVNSSENRKCHHNNNNVGVRKKLKDLLVSSSPPSPRLLEEKGCDEIKRWGVDGGGGMIFRRGGGGLRGRLSGTLRQRLLRRAWRPVLVTIPE